MRRNSRECGDKSNRGKEENELNDDETAAGIVTGIYVDADKEQEGCLRKRLRIGDVAR